MSMRDSKKLFIMPWVLCCLIPSVLFCASPSYEKPLVVVIPSYNNSNWYEWNLDSVFSQRYQNYRVIYIDDASSDGTGELVQKYLQKSDQKHRVTFFQNYVNKRKLHNMYRAIHSCTDDEIIVELDGDDAFAHQDVLARINKEYQNPNIWLTYGQNQRIPDGFSGYCHQYPDEVIKNRSFRSYDMSPSALRTYYAWLFKKIKIEDLQLSGKFFGVAGDIAMMFPMLDMAGDRFKYISDILYWYNATNPINDFRAHRKLQDDIANIVKAKPKYARLESLNISQMTNESFLPTSSFVYVDFDKSMGTPQRIPNYWLKNDEEWLTRWKVHYEKNNPSRIQPLDQLIIPKIIHQIWLGGPLPEKYKHWIDSWKKHHPTWEYKLWTDDDVKKLNLYNQELYDNLTNFGPKVDILRYEILYQFGGLYVDTDFECFKSHDILHHCYSFYAGIEDGKAIALGNALLASAPGHPILEQLVKNVNFKVENEDNMWATVAGTGPGYITQIFAACWGSSDSRVMVLPHSYFYPFPAYKRKVPLAQRGAFVKPETFGMHHWGFSWMK